MRIERLLTLELDDQPGQGASGAGGPRRGRLALGDQPDWTIEVSVRRAVDPIAEALLARAAVLLVHPVEGIAPVVDLGRVGVEAYVAHRWAPGRSLEALLGDGLDRAALDRILAGVALVLVRAQAVLPAGQAAIAALSLEQIYATVDPGPVWITDWLGASLTAELQVEAVCRALGHRAQPRLIARPAAVVARPAALGFDAALGAALAGAEAEPPASEQATVAAVGGARTQALSLAERMAAPAALAPVAVATPIESAPSGETAIVPRRPIGTYLLGGAIGTSLVLAAVMLRRGPATVVAPTPPPVAPIAAAPTVPAPGSPPSVALPEVPRASSPAHPPRAHARVDVPAEASVSLRSDVAAGVYVDGRYAGETPIAHLALAAGRHRFRLEAREGAMRLLPREEEVTLTAGERRALTIELK